MDRVTDSGQQNKFHITVGTAPGRGLSLTQELRLLKAALLYADQVKFCSIASSFLISMLQIGNLTGDQIAELFVRISKDSQFEQNVKLYFQLKAKKRRTGKELIAYKQVEAYFQKAQHEMQSSIEKMVLEAGIDSVAAAIQSGVVEIEIFNAADQKGMVNAYLETVGKAVLSGETYPLFDDMTGDLVNAAIRAGKIKPTDVAINRAKQVGLSSDLLSRLPLFDDASIDEVLDIRKELDKPLIRFRSAIIQFARDVQSASWDKEFPKEAEQVFREHVAPAVLDIEEACKSNKLLFRLIPDLVEKPLAPATASALTLLLAQATQLPEIVAGGLGVAAGASAAVLRSMQDWREQNREIEGNQLYFYYRTGKLLSD